MDRYRDQLVFLGIVRSAQEMADFYAACDLLALPSDTECFALVQVEAMLCGTPVVMTDVPGGRMPVATTGMGRLAPRGDWQAIGDAIVEVLDHRERYVKAREAIAAHWLGGAPVARPRADADRLILTASTSEAYAFLFKLLCGPGDTILVPAPSYPLFDYLAALEGVAVATYPLALEERFRVDPDAIAARLRRPGSRPPRAVVLVNPNNPTGTGLATPEREAIDRLCADAGAALVSDEVFLDYGWGAAPVATTAGPVADGAPAALTFTLGGLSKGSALPQMKLGWMLADGPGAACAEALERLELIADSYLSVGTPVQLAAPRLLELGDALGRRVRERIRTNLDQLGKAIPPDAACRLLPADGGWTAVIQVPAVRSEEDLVLELLRDGDLLVHPGYFFDFPREAFVVISLLPEPAPFAEGIDRLLERTGR
ncbi:MAG TPA: aminotransferase class I/II-fold pyridoxal phosphate-dependent enzyme [Dongiaceae bacterium]|nr:aminotransferase class I/II-fold pyridoxal phosphate-dependent enzyme [Dongiaceae bacterium]